RSVHGLTAKDLPNHLQVGVLHTIDWVRVHGPESAGNQKADEVESTQQCGQRGENGRRAEPNEPARAQSQRRRGTARSWVHSESGFYPAANRWRRAGAASLGPSLPRPCGPEKRRGWGRRGRPPRGWTQK